MKCHYCHGPTKIVAHLGDKPILAECLDYGKEGNFCKRTTIPIITECLECKKEFEWLFDPGWNEEPTCLPCKGKRMKEYFEDPEVKEAIRAEIKERSRLLDKIPKSKEWLGGMVTVPFKMKD